MNYYIPNENVGVLFINGKVLVQHMPDLNLTHLDAFQCFVFATCSNYK